MFLHNVPLPLSKLFMSSFANLMLHIEIMNGNHRRSLVLSWLCAKLVGTFREKVSNSNKSRRAFQVTLCWAETALGFMAMWANVPVGSHWVWGRLFKKKTLFKRQPVYLCENRTNRKLVRVDVDLSIHDYASCLGYHEDVLLLLCWYMSIILILE